MDQIHETLRDFAKHYTDYIPEIPVLDHIPSPNEFVSHYIIPNKPFVISCPENHLPAVEKWQKTFYLEDKMFYPYINVWVTPFHKPYPIVEGVYIEPELRSMQCYDVLWGMRRRPYYDEFYYVKQPDNLKDFALIAADFRADVPWATEALGSGPIAANLSIYNEDHISLMHKDEYDNFFYVLRGSRRFKLVPPIAHVCMPYKKFKKYQWLKNMTTDEWEKKDLNEEIEVILSESEPDTLEKNGFYRNIKSYTVNINRGDALYIPALWFYEYYPSDDCFTLNYWYDLKWDLKFPLLRFLSKLFKLKKPSMYKDASVDTQTELEGQYFKELWDETMYSIKKRS